MSDNRIRHYSVTIRHIVSEITINVWARSMDYQSAVMAAQDAFDNADPKEIAAKSKVINTMEIGDVRFVRADEDPGANASVSAPKPSIDPKITEALSHL